LIYAPFFPPQSDQVPSIFVSLKSQLVVLMKPSRLRSSGKELAHAVRSSGTRGHHLVLSRNVAHTRIYDRVIANGVRELVARLTELRFGNPVVAGRHVHVGWASVIETQYQLNSVVAAVVARTFKS
jgi:hypothetical protein